MATPAKYAVELDRTLKNVGNTLAQGVGQVAIRAGAAQIVRRAKSLVPVRTGTLRESITIFDAPPKRAPLVASVRGSSGFSSTVYFGSTVRYAAMIEFGTRFQSAQPYLRPAMDGQAEVVKVIAQVLAQYVLLKVSYSANPDVQIRMNPYTTFARVLEGYGVSGTTISARAARESSRRRMRAIQRALR